MASLSDSENSKESNEVSLMYEEILKKNGIIDPVSKIVVKDAGLVGEGESSQGYYVTVQFENPDLPQLNLFGKGVTSNAYHTAMLKELRSFEKEARFYMEYVPVAKKLCEKKEQLELMDIYPKCYHANDKLIVQENLVEDGYTLQKKEDKQGLEEAKAALISLAKHHAISYAMIRNYGGAEGFLEIFEDFDYDQFTKPCFMKMMEPMIARSVTNNTKMLEKYSVEGRDVALERLQKEGKKGFETMVKVLKCDEDDTILVLNHGDYHGNNMMFKRDPESQEILHQKQIDFQLVRYNSPGVDLGYFLFISVKPEVRQAHLKELLTVYLDTFNKVCGDLGHHIDYSYDDLFLQFRKKFKHGFWVGFISVGVPPSIMQDISVNQMEEISDFAVEVDKAVQKWIDENLDKGEQVAKNIVDVINEYFELSLDN